MPIQGFVRLRKHQFGRQAVFGTLQEGLEVDAL
jgi:hypothetical protein